MGCIEVTPCSNSPFLRRMDIPNKVEFEGVLKEFLGEYAKQTGVPLFRPEVSEISDKVYQWITTPLTKIHSSSKVECDLVAQYAGLETTPETMLTVARPEVAADVLFKAIRDIDELACFPIEEHNKPILRQWLAKMVWSLRRKPRRNYSDEAIRLAQECIEEITSSDTQGIAELFRTGALSGPEAFLDAFVSLCEYLDRIAYDWCTPTADVPGIAKHFEDVTKRKPSIKDALLLSMSDLRDYVHQHHAMDLLLLLRGRVNEENVRNLLADSGFCTVAVTKFQEIGTALNIWSPAINFFHYTCSQRQPLLERLQDVSADTSDAAAMAKQILGKLGLEGPHVNEVVKAAVETLSQVPLSSPAPPAA